ncbi:AAA family ATPase [Methanobacterium oryzae]|uniref:AAA family ATPase n=1 Tax=Methanobacterium oryzae TaxID=69540 RepID=UPI003D191271
MGKIKNVVVAGDITIDWLHWAIKPKNDGEEFLNWKVYPGFNRKALAGGALIIKDILNENTNVNVISYELEENLDSISSDKVIHSISILDDYSIDKDTVYRIKKFSGFSGPETGLPEIPHVKNDIKDVDMVILDDAGNGFRDDSSNWPETIKSNGKHPFVIVKMSRPLMKGNLWNQLINSNAKRLVLIINANDLREMGVNISRRISWERTATEFRWQIENNPALEDLRTNEIIVRFGIDGAIHYQNENGKPEITLYYDPNGVEDGYREDNQGDMQGFGSVFTAALAKEIIDSQSNNISEGIKRGILASRNLIRHGFGKTSENPHYPYKDIFNDIDKNIISSTLIPEQSKANSWTILEDSIKETNLEDAAFEIVRYGKAKNMCDVPIGNFGLLRTLDRVEIESYQSIKNLMKEYLGRENPEAPLSIAVFGPPGSGKSFGVTQLARTLDPDHIKKLEFNVAQFNSLEDLIDALHKVRDQALLGKVPLVFFDEFDSSFEGKLGWLKYFLAPMQDGIFKDGETMHPIGKSIFVFAGGTSNSFQHFSREKINSNLDKKQVEEDFNQFREAKGTDFISRLRGYVNVLGPNCTGEDDRFFIIRRALFLRSMLENKAPQIFESDEKARIDDGVLRAFLKIKNYKHGVRSISAIIEMSMLSNRRTYEQSSLPPKEQLEMHVDSVLFSEILDQCN